LVSNLKIDLKSETASANRCKE